MSDITNRTLTHICVNEICHCDFRLSIYECVESFQLQIINYIHITLSIISILIGIAILYHQIIINGNSLININYYQQHIYRRPFIRPRPLECLITCAVIFNIFRIIESVVLLTDILRNNIIFRSWIFEISWEFGFMGIALYLIGISQLLVEGNQTLFIDWLPSSIILDIISSWVIFTPLIINNILSILSGYYATEGLIIKAETTTRILYVMWFIHCTTLTILIIVAGTRLIRIMVNYLIANYHLRQSQMTEYYNIKSNILKTKSLIALSCLCLMGFAIFLLHYAILRTRIILDIKGNIALCIIWNLFGVGNTIGFELIVIMFSKMFHHHLDPYNNNNNNNNNSNSNNNNNGNNGNKTIGRNSCSSNHTNNTLHHQNNGLVHLHQYHQHNNNSSHFMYGNVNNNQPYHGISDHQSDHSEDDNHTRFETMSDNSSTSFNEADADNYQDLVYQLQRINYKSQLEQFQQSSHRK